MIECWQEFEVEPRRWTHPGLHIDWRRPVGCRLRLQPPRTVALCEAPLAELDPLLHHQPRSSMPLGWMVQEKFDVEMVWVSPKPLWRRRVMDGHLESADPCCESFEVWRPWLVKSDHRWSPR